jgi:hypothetical protein
VVANRDGLPHRWFHADVGLTMQELSIWIAAIMLHMLLLGGIKLTRCPGENGEYNRVDVVGCQVQAENCCRSTKVTFVVRKATEDGNFFAGYCLR